MCQNVVNNWEKCVSTLTFRYVDLTLFFMLLELLCIAMQAGPSFYIYSFRTYRFLYVDVSWISIQKRAVNKARQKERKEVSTQKFCLWQIVWKTSRVNGLRDGEMHKPRLWIFCLYCYCFIVVVCVFKNWKKYSVLILILHIKFLWLCFNGFRKDWTDIQFCYLYVYTKSY